MKTTLLRPSQKRRPRIVSFYSFKGGVGRTLALVNSAFSLASRGKNVILIDFDLEAPGLDAFPLLKPPTPTHGLLEYMEEYLRMGASPDLRRFVRKLYEAPGEGSIHIIYAGNFDEKYPERLGKINWTDFYTKHKGYYFFENLKDELRSEFSPDYVLIDTRTGQADVTGVATIHLPDVVVLMYALDEQNLRGAARMADAIRNNPIKKPIQVIPVASRVPIAADYSNLLKDRLQEAQRRGIQPSVVLPAEPSLSFGEAILGQRPGDMPTFLSQSPLRVKIEELVAEIINSNPEDPDSLLEEARRAFTHGDREHVWELFASIGQSLVSPRTWVEFGTLMMGTGKYTEAVQALNKARELSPEWTEPLIKLAQVAISSPNRNLPEAVLYAKQYIEQGGRGFDEVFGLAQGLLRAGATTDAEPLLRWCMQSQNSILADRARADLVLVLIADDLISEALALMEQLFSRDRQSAENVVWLYNYAETLRRAKRPESAQAFTRFLKEAGPLETILVNSMLGSFSIPTVFEGSLVFETQLANFAQAIGHALAVVGEKSRARTYLERAVDLAQRVGPSRVIFSTVSYKYEAPATFIEQTRYLLSSEIGVNEQAPGDLFTRN